MSAKLPLTAIVIAYNEAASLPACLASLSFAAEIIVADDSSTDDTLAVARAHSASTLVLTPTPSYSAKRNRALAVAKHDWILFVDADEVVTPECATQIAAAILDDTIHGYYLPRTDTFLGRTLHHGETGSLSLIRLANRAYGTWTRDVHEIWQITGRVGKLSAGLLHRPHSDIGAFLTALDHYSELEAHYRVTRATSPRALYRRTLFELFTYPLAKFLRNYFLLAGYLDGVPGFFHAYCMSLHSLFVRIKTIEHL